MSETNGKVVCMVTGGSGLYGMAIRAHVDSSAEEKDATWVFLSSKDGDLRDRKATEAIFERVRPTHVIHLAAMVGGLFANMSKKVEFYRENMWRPAWKFEPSTLRCPLYSLVDSHTG